MEQFLEEKKKDFALNVKNVDKFRGCLIGGAIGDALGYPIEFERVILKPTTRLLSNNVVSDDTQMTLFTANGLLCWQTSSSKEETVSDAIYMAYQDWLKTQSSTYQGNRNICWLLEVPELHQQRAPGMTCLSALLSGQKGTIENPINQSKGCGSVMRVAPIGLFFPSASLSQIGLYGAEAGAITHGHPLGIMPCYLLTILIHLLAYTNLEIEECVKLALKDFQQNFSYYNAEIKKQMIDIIEKAISLAHQKGKDQNNISELGEGWVAEEALAIAIYACVKYEDDFEKAIVCAVNHGGDSDSTGSIAGNIMGTYLGYEKIPDFYKDKVELRDTILEIAEDLSRDFPVHQYADSKDEKWIKKYLYWKK